MTSGARLSYRNTLSYWIWRECRPYCRRGRAPISGDRGEGGLAPWGLVCRAFKASFAIQFKTGTAITRGNRQRLEFSGPNSEISRVRRLFCRCRGAPTGGDGGSGGMAPGAVEPAGILPGHPVLGAGGAERRRDLGAAHRPASLQRQQTVGTCRSALILHQGRMSHSCYVNSSFL